MNFCEQKLCVNNTNITFFFREGGLTLAAKMDSFETGETLFSNASSNNFNSESAEDKNDIEGAWGSSSYGNVNSTVNLTTDEYLYMYMGPKQVSVEIA